MSYISDSEDENIKVNSASNSIDTVTTGGCFAPGSMVLMAAGLSLMPIENLQRGDIVYTTSGDATVEYVIEMNINAKGRRMCKLGSLWITPGHPVYINNRWRYAQEISPPFERTESKVYNLILDQGHVINVSGNNSCTLGHGLKGTVIEHPYFGNKTAIINDLKSLPGFDVGRPVFTNHKYLEKDGVICGWYNQN